MTTIKTAPVRILSVDVFRALTMFLMIFVNDVGSIVNIPNWIEHTPANVDGMGFSDIIFPAFLFIVGLSLPMAIQSRMDRGANWRDMLMYIVSRAFALIVMGFFHVNLESYNAASYFSYPVFTILITVAFFLLWMDYPKQLQKKWIYVLKATGAVILLFMAYMYKGGEDNALHGMRPEWWGILGIIGWAYLVTALVYLLTKGNKFLLAGAAFLFFAINVFTHAKVIDLDLPIVGDASSISLIMGGILTSIYYKTLRSTWVAAPFWLMLAGLGFMAICFGFFVRPVAGGISKIYATPAWVFICMGISILVYELAIWLIDVKHQQKWFKVIKPAGTSTLTCYLIPYVLYALFSLVGFTFPAFFNEGAGGILRSFAISFLVIGIVGVLEKRSIKLKV